jgi:hypothetical protein
MVASVIDVDKLCVIVKAVRTGKLMSGRHQPQAPAATRYQKKQPWNLLLQASRAQ